MAKDWRYLNWKIRVWYILYNDKLRTIMQLNCQLTTSKMMRISAVYICGITMRCE